LIINNFKGNSRQTPDYKIIYIRQFIKEITYQHVGTILMKILLVQANSMKQKNGQDWATGRSKMAYAPTSITTLASLVPPELNAQVEIIDEGTDSIPQNFQADILGISVITPNAPRAYQLADEARKRGITVVMGGYHPTILPQEAAEHADAVVIGYAEKAWPRLLFDYKSGNLKKFYNEPALDLFKAGGIYPDRKLLNSKRYLFSQTMETTRGCKNVCSYCIIPTISQRNYAHRDLADIISEIKTMSSKNIVFLDSSLSESIAFSKQLFKAMIPLKKKWYGNITLKSLHDDSWIELAAASGCRGVLIGFESINQASIDGQNKSFNRVEEYLSAIKKLKKHNIALVACFVFGFDHDDSGVFKKTVDFIQKSGIDLAYFGIFTPFPSTPEYEKMKKEGRILTEDWSRYDGTNVVFKPAKMSQEELYNGLRYAWEKTYEFKSIAKRLIKSRSLILTRLAASLGYRQYSKSLKIKA